MLLKIQELDQRLQSQETATAEVIAVGKSLKDILSEATQGKQAAQTLQAGQPGQPARPGSNPLVDQVLAALAGNVFQPPDPFKELAMQMMKNNLAQQNLITIAIAKSLGVEITKDVVKSLGLGSAGAGAEGKA